MPEFIEVTAEVLAERQASDRRRQYEQRQQQRVTRGLEFNGNPISAEQFLAEYAVGEEMARNTTLATQAAERLRAAEQREAEQEAARVKDQAGKDAEAALKEQYRKTWPYSAALFEAQWPDILADHVRAEARKAREANSSEAYRAKMLAEGRYT